jgi:hypothetical protein
MENFPNQPFYFTMFCKDEKEKITKLQYETYASHISFIFYTLFIRFIRKRLYYIVFLGISLKIKGEAEVKWEEERSHTSSNTDATSNNRPETETYSNEEVYFENKVNVFGGSKYKFSHSPMIFYK